MCLATSTWASVDVQNRVNQALGRLPNEVKNTGVIITKQLGGFVFAAGIYSENGAYDSLFSAITSIFM